MNAIIIGILLPLLGTMLGSAFVFFMKKEIPDRMQKTLLGFASGVMVAAAVLVMVGDDAESFEGIDQQILCVSHLRVLAAHAEILQPAHPAVS